MTITLLYNVMPWGVGWILTLKMEAEYSSAALVPTYQTR